MFDFAEPFRCHDRAAAEILDEWNSFRAGKLCQRFSARRFNKPGHEEIASMHFQDQRRVRSERSRVITKPGFVRGADLAQFRATGFKNVRNAKASADLDQFTARDDNFFFLRGEMPQDKDERRGTIVDDSRCFRAAEESEILLKVTRAMTPLPAIQVEFEIAIILGDRAQRFDDGRTER